MNDPMMNLLDGMLKEAERRMPQVPQELVEARQIESRIRARERSPKWLSDLSACLQVAAEDFLAAHPELDRERKHEDRLREIFIRLRAELEGIE
jgi:hypothetical protein